MKKKKCAIALICATTLILGSSVTAYAALNGTNSNGKIVFNGPDNVSNTSDDIIFDSYDFNVLDNKINAGKKTLAGTMNSKGNASIVLANAFDLTSNDILFSDLNTQLGRQFEMPTIVTNLYTNRTNGLNLSGSNTGDTPVNGTAVVGGAGVAIDGVSYLSADALSAGKTAWDNNGNAVIGNGKSNIDSYNDGYTQGVNDVRAGLVNAQIVYRFHVHTNADGGNTSYEGSSVTYDGSVSMPEISPTQGGCYQTEVHKTHTHAGGGGSVVTDRYGRRAHTSPGGCYTASSQYVSGYHEDWVRCGGNVVYSGPYYDGAGREYHVGVCKKCGKEYSEGTDLTTVCTNTIKDNVPTYSTCYVIGCGKTEGVRYDNEEVEGYTCTCGHTHGELEGAVISFP